MITSGGVTVVIAAGSLDADDTITIERVELIDVLGPLPGIQAGPLVDITLAAQNTFNSAITISLPYNDTDQNGIVDGIDPPVDETTLLMFYFDSDLSDWIQILDTEVFVDDNVIVGQIDHLTPFGVSGEAASSTPTTSNDGGGGGCALHPEAGFNPMLAITLGAMLGYLGWRRARRHTRD